MISQEDFTLYCELTREWFTLRRNIKQLEDRLNAVQEKINAVSDKMIEGPVSLRTV